MAESLIYHSLGTPLTFHDSGGTAALALQNLAPGVGVISARVAVARPGLHRVRGIFQFETAPLLGETVEIYVATSDGTYADGVVGTASAALTLDQVRNLGQPVCIVKAQTIATATDNIGSELFYLISAFFSIGVVNRSAADNLENTANASRVIVEPWPPALQAAA